LDATKTGVIINNKLQGNTLITVLIVMLIGSLLAVQSLSSSIITYRSNLSAQITANALSAAELALKAAAERMPVLTETDPRIIPQQPLSYFLEKTNDWWVQANAPEIIRQPVPEEIGEARYIIDHLGFIPNTTDNSLIIGDHFLRITAFGINQLDHGSILLQSTWRQRVFLAQDESEQRETTFLSWQQLR